MKDSVLHVRVNSKIKNDADEILNNLGISMSVAVNMFLKKVCITKGIPFDLTYEDYNETTQRVIKNSYCVAEETEEYKTVDELFEDAKNWKE